MCLVDHGLTHFNQANEEKKRRKHNSALSSLTTINSVQALSRAASYMVNRSNASGLASQFDVYDDDEDEDEGVVRAYYRKHIARSQE